MQVFIFEKQKAPQRDAEELGFAGFVRKKDFRNFCLEEDLDFW